MEHRVRRQVIEEQPTQVNTWYPNIIGNVGGISYTSVPASSVSNSYNAGDLLRGGLSK